MLTTITPIFIIAVVIALVQIPVLRKIAVRIGLVDKPGGRKVHSDHVPLIGGVSVFLSTLLAIFSNPVAAAWLQPELIWIGCAVVMLLIGVLDDRFNISAAGRLLIQLSCAAIVAWSGIRITSLYGLFGVFELPIYVQYGLTMVVIAGVVNAYNLMDGIDGLLGSLTLVACGVLGSIAYERQMYSFLLVYAAIAGSIIGFLRFNLSKKKIFMGDAGSLFLGFVLVVSAIRILNSATDDVLEKQLEIFLMVAGIFLVPVLDSLRVYRGRVKKGVSPFKADRTHLHHLFLFLGITHKKAMVLIVFVAILVILVILGLLYLVPAAWVVFGGVAFFAIVAGFLSMHGQVQEWTKKVKALELM